MDNGYRSNRKEEYGPGGEMRFFFDVAYLVKVYLLYDMII